MTQYTKLKLCNVNAQNAQVHIEELNEICKINAPDLFGVTSTNFTNEIQDVELTGYAMIRQDCSETMGSGIALFIKNNFMENNFEKIISMGFNENYEHISIQFNINNQSSCLCLGYRPTKNCPLAELEKSLATLSEISDTKLFVMGDFCINLLNFEENIEYKKLSLKFGISTNQTGTTRTIDNVPRLVDLIMSNVQEDRDSLKQVKGVGANACVVAIYNFSNVVVIKDDITNNLNSNFKFPKLVFPSTTRSSYWNYFGYESEDGKTGIAHVKDVICVLCGRVVCFRKSTGNLRTHLKYIHKDIYSMLFFKHELIDNPIANKCRICMNDSGIIRSFNEYKGEYSVAEMIMACAPVNVSNDDGMPQSICEKCLKRVSIAFKLKNQIIQGDSILSDGFDKKKKTVQRTHINKPPELQAKAVVTGVKYACELCNKQYTKLTDIKRHMRSHTGEKNALCNVCGKSFARRDVLARHLATHGIVINPREKKTSKLKSPDVSYCIGQENIVKLEISVATVNDGDL